MKIFNILLLLSVVTFGNLANAFTKIQGRNAFGDKLLQKQNTITSITQRCQEEHILSNSHVSFLRTQRRSVASVATMGLFGLGGPEIIVILIAVGFLLGPEKLVSIGVDAGKEAGEFAKELKEVPTEFQKGMEEGEARAKMRKRKKEKINMGANEPIKTVDATEIEE